ncbi:MAG: hypothetical protein JWQ40_2868 [Segetibacter sp.]|nr:hypothetical protein [Segetibacter sp.]
MRTATFIECYGKMLQQITAAVVYKKGLSGLTTEKSAEI